MKRRCLRRNPASRLEDFEALPHAIFSELFLPMLSIIQIPSLLSRNPCLTPSNAKSDIKDYYILNLKDPMYIISIALDVWLKHCQFACELLRKSIISSSPKVKFVFLRRDYFSRLLKDFQKQACLTIFFRRICSSRKR